MGAYQLSRFGIAADKALLEQRLEQVRQQWHGQSAALEIARPSSPKAEARSLEADLVSTLVRRQDNLWAVTPEEKERLREGCLTSRCRRYFLPTR